MEPFNQVLTKFPFFINIFNLFTMICKREIENFEFVRGVNFYFIDSLKNNGTMYLLDFDDSCEEICNSKALVDIATAGRHQGLSTIYIKHNIFHHSKQEETLSYKTLTLFPSSLPVT